MTRPGHWKIADYPGTLSNRGGVCDFCYRKRPPVILPGARERHEYNLAGLNAFLARRREREARLERARA